MTDTAEQHVARAERLTALGRYAEAERVARDGLAEDPEHTGLLGELADTLSRQDRHAEALEAAEAALAGAPGFVWAHQLRAEALSALGRYAEAVAAAHTAIEISPNQAGPWQTLAQVLAEADQTVDAKRAADRCVELAPHSADAHCLRGNMLLRLGYPQVAADAYRAALRQDPSHAGAVHNLAVTELAVRNVGKALRGLLQAGQLEPQLRELRPNLVRALSAASWHARLALAGADLVIAVLGLGPGAVRLLAALVLLLGLGVLAWPLRGLPAQARSALQHLVRGEPRLRVDYLALATVVVVQLAAVAVGTAGLVAAIVVFGLGAVGSVVAAMRGR